MRTSTQAGLLRFVTCALRIVIAALMAKKMGAASVSWITHSPDKIEGLHCDMMRCGSR